MNTDNITAQASVKEVTQIRIGNYSVTIDADKLAILARFSGGSLPELRQIQEMTDWILDMCSGIEPTDDECLRFMKYLRCLRSAFESLQLIDVKETPY